MEEINDIVDDNESLGFVPNQNNFFDGLFGSTSNQTKIVSITEKVTQNTNQHQSKATTLQQKIDKKKRRMERRNQNQDYPQEEQNQDQNDIQEIDIQNQEYKDQYEGTIFCLDTQFQQLKLGKGLLKALSDLKFFNPTKVQKEAIPLILSGKDVLVNSITGSGKTAAFLLPVLQRFGNTKFSNYSKALIVLPTRELAVQCYQMFEQLNTYTKCTGCLVIGAVNIAKQEAELRKHPDIIFATPGRLIDLLTNSYNVDIQNIEMLIFDEADRLLEMGFEAEIKEIIKECPEDRQTLLFSATMTTGIKTLTSLALKKPIKLQIDFDGALAYGLKQYIVRLHSDEEIDREAALMGLIKTRFNSRCIIFVKTKHHCHRLAIILGLLGVKATELHGNLSQNQRIESFEEFKKGNFDFLLATDLAARGLDIDDVKVVINLEIPYEAKRYIHRVGRTARKGNEGVSLTICLESEVRKFKKMIRESKQELFCLSVGKQSVERWKKKIEQLETEIRHILSEEKNETQIRRLEIMHKKAENMMEHLDDIKRKPRKQWFENVDQKLKRQKLK